MKAYHQREERTGDDRYRGPSTLSFVTGGPKVLSAEASSPAPRELHSAPALSQVTAPPAAPSAPTAEPGQLPLSSSFGCVRGDSAFQTGRTPADCPPHTANYAPVAASLADGLRLEPVQTKETPGVPTSPRAGNGGAGPRPRRPSRSALAIGENRLSPAELACLPVRPGCLAAFGIAELGASPVDLAERTDWLPRARALQWAGGIRLDCRTCQGAGELDDGEELVTCGACNGTGDGRDRGRAIAACGRPALAMTAGGLVGLVGLRCRDRACPRCQRLRAIERAAELREAMASCPACRGLGSLAEGGEEHLKQQAQEDRSDWTDNDDGDDDEEDGGKVHSATVPCRACGSRGSVPWRWQFATLTIPKVHPTERGCRETLDAVLGYWRALTRQSHALGRAFYERFQGGVRSIEVVYRERGEVIRYPGGRTHVVEMTGWHVHVHALLDVRGDVDDSEARGWLVARWLELTGASSRGQHVKPVERGDTGCAVELCKYVAKPLSQAMAPAVGRELFHALHSRRLLEGMGRWRGWRKIVEHDSPSLLIGPSVGGLLARMHGDGPNPVRNFLGTTEGRRILADERRDNPIAIFEGHIDGEKWTVQTSAARAWELVSTGDRHAAMHEEVRARGLSPPRWERDPFLWSRCTLGEWDSSTSSLTHSSTEPGKSSRPSLTSSPTESKPARPPTGNGP